MTKRNVAVAATTMMLMLSAAACESDEDKCKSVCNDTVAKEHGADSEAVKTCLELCEKGSE